MVSYRVVCEVLYGGSAVLLKNEPGEVRFWSLYIYMNPQITVWCSGFVVSSFQDIRNLWKPTLLLIKLGSTSIIQQRPSFEMIKYNRQPLILTQCALRDRRPHLAWAMLNLMTLHLKNPHNTSITFDLQSPLTILSRLSLKYAEEFSIFSTFLIHSTTSLFNLYKANSKCQS